MAQDSAGMSATALEHQTALFSAVKVLTGDLRPQAVLQRLVVEATGLLEADAADCYVYEEERRTFRCVAAHGLDGELVGWEFPADEGLASEVLRRGRSQLAQDYPGLRVPHPAYDGFCAAACAPMIWSGETRGVLGVGSRDPAREFGLADAAALEAFASLASLALRNAASFEASERQARIQRGFYRIAAVLGESLSLSQTSHAVAQIAAEALGGDFAAVLIPGAAGLELAGAQDLPGPLSEALRRGLPQSASALTSSARDRRILASEAVAEDDRFDAEWRELLAGSGCRSLLAVPLEHPGSDEAGVVLVFFATERSTTDDDLELSAHLADAAKGALERSELFEAERRSRALAQELARTTSAVARELDPAGVLQEVVRRVPRLLGVDACAIWMFEEDDLVAVAVEGWGSEEVLGTKIAATGRPAGDIIQSSEPLLVSSVSSDRELAEADPVLAAGHEAYLGVPLAGREGVMHGVLSVYSRRRRSWREEEVEALLALGGNAAAALASAELYQRVALEKERSDAILASIADGIVATGPEGEVVLWNAAAEDITGVPRAEAMGRTTEQVLQRRLASDGDAALGDRLVSILRGGDEVWLSLTEAVMRDGQGAVAGRVYAFRDISAEHQVEQLKSDFVSSVSHELRTPLTSIYGFAATLLRNDVLFGDEERSTFLGYIAAEAERLTNIVDAFLNVTRLETGDLELQLGPTDIGEIVEGSIALIEERAEHSIHRFVLDFPEQPVKARADPAQLRQIVTHLLDNAVRYSPDGGLVTLRLREAGNAVHLQVADEGIGIPQSEQQRIFTKFYRATVRQRGPHEERGPSLSLYIVRGLANAMGGRISVSSTEGQGSTFTVELPLEHEPVTTPAAKPRRITEVRS